MNRKSEKAFTLIELLAVIIILAIVALISTPIILNVVDEARESANKSSVAMYADSVKLAVIDNYFENQSYPAVNIDWVNDNVEYGGEKITCKEAYYTESEGVTLHECTIGDTAVNYVDDMKVSAENTVYCYTKGMVYTDCEDLTYKESYDIAVASAGSTQTGYVDESNANQPELFNNMVAVKYDYTNQEWLVANTDEKWYDYDNSEWANAVVLNENTIEGDDTSHSREYYLNNVGTEINMDDISQMYVWIPRYKYTLFNGENNNAEVSPQEIIIEFENGITSSGTVTCVNNEDGSETCTDKKGTIENGISTYTHPAFTLGSKELKGIWVGKFETSTKTACTAASYSVDVDCDLTTLGIQIKPNVTSWRGARVSTFYTAIKNLSVQNSMISDSHMMKNMEWGAIAYLSHSIYGKNDEVWINNSSSYTTGCAGGSESESSFLGCQNLYNTLNGQQASTTGNIYGIYDMSGGATEYVMGNMLDSNGNFYSSSAGFDENPESQYYDFYQYDSSQVTHYRGKLGDATKETLFSYGNSTGGWYRDYAALPYSTFSWLLRGEDYSRAKYAGIFSFNRRVGCSYDNYAVRVVVSAID